jgi:hypothetical protein
MPQTVTPKFFRRISGRKLRSRKVVVSCTLYKPSVGIRSPIANHSSRQQEVTSHHFHQEINDVGVLNFFPDIKVRSKGRSGRDLFMGEPGYINHDGYKELHALFTAAEFAAQLTPAAASHAALPTRQSSVGLVSTANRLCQWKPEA